MYLFLRLFLFFFIVFSTSLFAGIKEAKRAYSQKQYQKAIKLFTEYSKTSPSDGEPFMFMGYVYESQKDFPRSMAMFRRAVELKLSQKQKKNSLLKIILFYNYHQGWDIVAHYSNKFLKIDPKNKEVARMRDRAYANKGHDPGILTFAKPEDLKAKHKKNKEAEEKKADQEREREREREKEQAREREKKESELAEKLSKNNSEERKWELSLKHFKEENYQEADKILQELISISPKNKNYLYKAGIAKLRLGEYEKAIQYFVSSKKLANEKDDQLLYYVNLNEGQANQKLGYTNTAIALYKKAFQHNKSPILFPVLMRLYYENSYFHECIKVADKILKSDSKNLEANMYKSLSFIGGGRKKIGYKGLLEFTKKINRKYTDLNTVPEKFHDGILQTGVFYSNRIKYKLALKYLTAVSSTKSTEAKFNFALGKTYFYTKKYPLAVVFLNKVPENPSANYLLAKYYATEKNIEKIKEHLSKATILREVYWTKVNKDPYFQEMLKDSDFYNFVNSKGKNNVSEKTNISPDSENKVKSNIPRIEPPSVKPDTVPTMETSNTLPSDNSSSEVKETPSLPSNNSSEGN